MSHGAKARRGFWTRAWVVKVVSHRAREATTVRIPPLKLLIGLLLLVCVAYAVNAQICAIQKRQAQEIQRLKDAHARKVSELARVKHEKEQVASLLEQQNTEFTRKLKLIQAQDNEIRRIVGLKPTNVAGRNLKIKGSRGGYAINHYQTRHQALQSEFKAAQSRLRNLKTAAVSYRREERRKELLAAMNATPSIWPANGYISSDYGWRIHPYGYSDFHRGLDVVAGYGAPIYATGAGVVKESGYYGGYGMTVIIDHGNGLSTLYGHCSELLVGVGRFVKKGQVVARIGMTGVSTGPHVHYEIHSAGSPVNPTAYLDSQTRHLAGSERGMASE